MCRSCASTQLVGTVWPPVRRTDEQDNFTREIIEELAILTGLPKKSTFPNPELAYSSKARRKIALSSTSTDCETKMDDACGSGSAIALGLTSTPANLSASSKRGSESKSRYACRAP